MYRKIVFSMAWLLATASFSLAAVEINPNNPGTYVVVKGDTLWDISGRFLRYPWQWPEIWEDNRHIKDPHWIYPGDVLSLNYRDGQPVLSVTRDGMIHLGGRNVKMVPTVREYGRDNAIPPIPLDAIQQFLSRPLVLDQESFDRAPYVLANSEDHVAGGVGSRIYIRGLEDPETIKYSLYRPDEPYFDPDAGEEGEVIGFAALHIGDVKLERLGDPATAYVVRSDREILKGDRVLPQEDERFPEFIPHAPSSDIDGRIISVVDGVSEIGQYNVVAINRGTESGLEPGHVLSIWQAGEFVDDKYGAVLEKKRALSQPVYVTGMEEDAIAEWLSRVATDLRDLKYKFDRFIGEPETLGAKPVQLPEERAGELMIFRSFDRVSFGLVLNTHRAVHVYDKVRNP